MATVNKDFKIKSGLIVEGTTATVNGHNILTESTSGDQYILNLIGGETLVKSVSNEFDVSQGGELSLDRTVVDGYYDAAGDAADAEQAAKDYADGLASNYDPAGSAQGAYDNAVSHTDTALESYTPTSSLDSTIDGYGFIKEADLAGYATETYVNTAAGQALTDAQAYADALIDDASNSSVEVWSAYKTSTEIGLAQAAAEQHADEAVANLVGSAPELLDTIQELATALENNPDIIADLENVAAGKQDTLTAGNGIALDGATISVDLADLISDSGTAGIDASYTVKVTADSNGDLAIMDSAITDKIAGEGIKSSKVSGHYYLAVDRNTTDGWYDANGAASSAETSANDYTDDAIAQEVTDRNAAIDALTTSDIEEGSRQYFTDTRAKISAADLLTGATKTNITITGDENGLTITAEDGIAGKTTDDLPEGEDNLYFQNSRVYDAIEGADISPASVAITNFRKEEATNQYVSSASTVTVHTLPMGVKTAKYLVRAVASVSGTIHTQLTEILMTIDGNNNIAITEYGTICTDINNLASFSAEYVGGSHKLISTTAVSNVEITAAVTMLTGAYVA